jgi:hypothetical protein
MVKNEITIQKLDMYDVRFSNGLLSENFLFKRKISGIVKTFKTSLLFKMLKEHSKNEQKYVRFFNVSGY